MNDIDEAAAAEAKKKLETLHKLQELRNRSVITTAFLSVQIVQEELRLLKEADGNLQEIHDLGLEDSSSLEYKELEARGVLSYYRDLCARNNVEPQL